TVGLQFSPLQPRGATQAPNGRERNKEQNRAAAYRNFQIVTCVYQEEIGRRRAEINARDVDLAFRMEWDVSPKHLRPPGPDLLGAVQFPALANRPQRGVARIRLAGEEHVNAEQGGVALEQLLEPALPEFHWWNLF